MFLEILTTITVPLLAVIALGYAGCRRLSLDPRTLGQLLINVVAPGAFFYFLVSNPAPMSAVGFVTLFSLAQFFVLYAIGWLVLSRLIVDPVVRRACALAVAFPNSGNYGIPLIDLAFGDAWLFHQSVITSMHSVLIVALVPILVPSRTLGFAASMRAAFKAPLLPAVMVGIAIKLIGVEMPPVLLAPLEVLASALTPLALLTLGTQIAMATQRPERFVGLHYFNPVPVMKLVEVVRTIATDDGVFDDVFDYVRATGKEPVACRDNSGFIVNRLLVPYLLDAIRAYEEGVGSVEDIDKAMQLGCGYPMGPLTLLDFVGLDTTYYIANIMFEEYREKRFAPPPLLKQMVLAGRHGRKSGRGFYDYGGS